MFQSIFSLLSNVMPIVIISGLLYAGLFIKPEPTGDALKEPVIEAKDKFFGVSMAGNEGLWVVGSFGKIIHSADKGEHWVKQNSGTKQHLQSVSAWDANHAIVVGNDGVTLVTDDGGKRWTRVETPRSEIANKLLRVKTRANGEAWIVGEVSALYQSTDFGKTWARRSGDEDISYNDLAFISNDVGWLVGEYGTIMKTIDAGLTWELMSAPVESSLMSISFADENNGIIVGLEGVILQTQDGGANWEQKQGVTTEHLFDVEYDAENKYWLAVGNKGLWQSYALDGTVKSSRFFTYDLSWHTDLLVNGGQAYVAGDNVGVWADDKWTVFN